MGMWISAKLSWLSLIRNGLPRCLYRKARKYSQDRFWLVWKRVVSGTKSPWREAQVASAEAALLRLRNGTRPEEIDQARAAVASAKAEVAFSQANHKRYSGIWKDSKGQAVSKQEVDQALLALNVARAKLLEEEKGLRLAEIGPREEDIVEAEAKLQENRLQSGRTRNQA